MCYITLRSDPVVTSVRGSKHTASTLVCELGFVTMTATGKEEEDGFFFFFFNKMQRKHFSNASTKNNCNFTKVQKKLNDSKGNFVVICIPNLFFLTTTRYFLSCAQMKI